MGLKELIGKAAPTLATMLGGPLAGSAVGMIANALGQPGADQDDLINILEADPGRLVDLKEAELAAKVSLREADSKDTSTVNETMRVEYSNQDGYVRRMRPTYGYVGAYCIALMFTTITVVMMWKGVDDAVKMIKAYSKMEWIIVALLAVIGVYVKKRSDDKKPPVMGLLGALAQRVGRK